jgi:hypothetical protein
MKLVIELEDGELSRAVANQVEAAISKLSTDEIVKQIQTIVGKKVDRVATDEVGGLVKQYVSEAIKDALRDSYGQKTLRQYAQEQIVIAARTLVSKG